MGEEWWIYGLVGISISITLGMRVFLPLFLFSLIIWKDWVILPADLQWVGDETLVIGLGITALIEILVFFIPVLSSVLNVISIPLGSLISGALMYSLLDGELGVSMATIFAVVSAVTPIIIRGVVSIFKGFLLVTTAGTGNVIYNIIEPLPIIAIFILIIIAPILMVVLFLGLAIVCWKLIKKLKKERRQEETV